MILFDGVFLAGALVSALAAVRYGFVKTLIGWVLVAGWSLLVVFQWRTFENVVASFLHAPVAFTPLFFLMSVGVTLLIASWLGRTYAQRGPGRRVDLVLGVSMSLIFWCLAFYTYVGVAAAFNVAFRDTGRNTVLTADQVATMRQALESNRFAHFLVPAVELERLSLDAAGPRHSADLTADAPVLTRERDLYLALVKDQLRESRAAPAAIDIFKYVPLAGRLTLADIR